MFFDWRFFVSNSFTLCCSAFLCIFSVRDRMTVPLSRTVWIVGSFIAAFCALLTTLPAMWTNMLIPPFLVPCFFIYQRVVRAARGKLLFIFFAVATYICFVSALFIMVTHIVGGGIPLFDAVSPSRTSAGELLVGMCLDISCAIPAYYMLRRKIWPLVRDLEMQEWSSLWIVPMIYTLVIVVFTEQMWSSDLGVWMYLTGMSLLGVGAFASYYLVLRMMQKSAESARAREQARMMELQLLHQREQYETLSGGIAQTRKARHDLRHSLAALQGYVQADDIAGLKQALGRLIGALPKDAEPMLCQNIAVNAVARHYLGQARQAGARVAARLDIPVDIPRPLEQDLCVLVGNLLENAAEACARMAQGERSIDAVAAMSGEYLSIAVTNSFDGDVRTKDGAYLSRKHDGEGIGISSVRAIARKYSGYASFTENAATFDASAVVRVTRSSVAASTDDLGESREVIGK